MRGHATSRFLALRGQLNAVLFRSVPPGDSTIGGGERLIVLVALLILAVILQLLRPGPANALGSIWAEDGSVFLQGAISDSFLHAIFSPYAGYLVLAPRLIGEVGNLAPLADIPAVVAIVASIVIALSAFVVWHASAPHIRNPYLRGTLAVLTFLAPVASLEAVTSGTYVGWYMLFATFWLLLWRPARISGAVLAALFILLTALSSPGVLYFAPIVALRAIAARDRRDLLILGSYAIGAAIQLPVILSSNESTIAPMWSSDIWVAYFQRVVDGGALGENLGGSAWVSFGWPFLIALLVLVAAGLALAAARSTPSGRYLTAIAVPTSLLMFLGSAYQRAAGPALIWPDGISHGLGGRYAIVPALLLVSAALVLIDQSTRARRGPGGVPWLGLAVVAVLALGMVTSFDLRNSAARGDPSWDDSLKTAAAACVSERLPEYHVETSPPGFGVVVSCDRIVAAASVSKAR